MDGLLGRREMERKCEAQDCNSPATFYGGYKNANDWAGYACTYHASVFFVWKERVK